MNSVPVDLQSPTYTPRKLLEEVMWVLHCKNRTELAVALGVDSGLICRFWNLKDPLTDGMLVRIADRTNWSMVYIRELAGVPYMGDVYPPRQRTVSVMPKAGANPRGVIILPKTPRNYHLAKEHILQAMPGTVAQLAKKSGYSRGTVDGWLKVLRAGDPLTRASHIADWQPPSGPNGEGPYTPIHAAGPGEDATCTIPHRRDRRRLGKWERFQPQHTAAQHSTAQNRA